MADNNSTVRVEVELRDLHKLRVDIEEALSPKVTFTPGDPEQMQLDADKIIQTRLLSMLDWVDEVIDDKVK